MNFPEISVNHLICIIHLSIGGAKADFSRHVPSSRMIKDTTCPSVYNPNQKLECAVSKFFKKDLFGSKQGQGSL